MPSDSDHPSTLSVVANGGTSFFMRGWIMFTRAHTYVHIDHIFFIHSSAGGLSADSSVPRPLGTGLRGTWDSDVSSGPWSRSLQTHTPMELLGHMVVLLLAVWEASMLFPKWLHQFTRLPRAYKGSHLQVLTNVCYRLSFDPSSMVVVLESHTGITLSPIWIWS